MIRSTLLAVLIALAGSAFAQNPEDAAAVLGGGPGQPDQPRGGVIPQPGELFAGTALNGPGGNNDTVLIDVDANTSRVFGTGIPVWGATYDPDNRRILFTTEGGTDSDVDGAPLYEVPIATGIPAFLGVINQVGGPDFRIDGLAWSNGVLYGTRAAGVEDGLYTIDMTTFAATLDFAYTDSISGIDADPDTGIIYGVNDSVGQLVAIDPAADTVTNVAAYPDAAETDIDGLAVGNGFAYLIPDDSAPGLIYVYDIAGGVFGTPLTAPWGPTDDIFSGGALVSAPALPESIPVPVNHPMALMLLALVAMLLGATVLIRRIG